MQITEIKKIGRGDRYSIFIDSVFDGTLEAEILVKHKLKTGDEIDEEQWRQIKLENGKLSAFSRAVGYIEKSLKTQKQLQNYLKEKGFLQESIDDAVQKLKEYSYIDDKVYAENYIKTYKDKKGKIKLKFDLLSKGVAADVIEEALQEFMDEDEQYAACEKLLKKYVKNKPQDVKLKSKAYAHLFSKGFSGDIISRAIGKVFSEVEDEDWN